MSGVLTPCPRSNPLGSGLFRLTTTLIAVTAGLLLGNPAQAVTINVPGGQPTIAAALAVAAPNDVILVAPGIYTITSTLSASTPNVTLQGSGIGSSVLQTSGAGNLLLVTGSGFTLRDFTIQKTDLVPANMIAIMASGCTVRDNEIYGVDPITPWAVNGLVIRGLAVSPGLSGLLVQNNYFHHIRQPAYIDAGTGSIVGNQVSGTRGWVVAGATLAFSGNTWGPLPSQGADIALLPSCNPLDYPNLLALSSSNGNAYVDAQYGSAPDGRADGYVDAAAPAPGGNLPGSAALPYQTVQGGVDGTLPGGTVHVAAGAYPEQVTISGKDLTVRGAGAGATTIQAPAVLATTFTTSGPNKPVITATGASNVRIEDLTVDGMGNGNANYRIVGIGYWNAGGAIEDVDVVRTRNTPLDGSQGGNGVLAANNTGGPYGMALTNVDVSDFQKNGITLTGTGLTVSVVGGSVNGAGNTALIAQNGIQISSGAGGSVNGTRIAGLRYTPATVVSVGLLVFGPGSVAASNLVGASAFSGVQVPAYYIDASGSINGAEVDATSSDQGALFAYNSSLSAAKTPTTEARSGAPEASPFDEPASEASRRLGDALLSSLTFSVSNACLSGSGTPNTQGIGVFSDGGPMAATVTNCTITGWDQGIYVDGAATSLVANDNSISGNVSAGLDNTTGGAGQDAERNWWGAMSGPSGVGPGSGNAILGAGVDFDPWRVSGVDLNPSCGFQPAVDNAVVPGPVPSCISLGNPCVTIPVVLNRTDSANLRGYSVDIQLSPQLVLCSTPGASITVGPYLATGAGFNGTSFQVTSNGGGSYTVDQAILGLPCGATGSGGTIFNLQVKAAGPGDATGTITVTSVTLRNCDNAPIAATAGAPLNVTIDQTAPSPITLLAASQIKVGNDGDGTTKIDLAWPPVEAGATVEVYRAGFGNHPEYDDPPTPGSAPAAPSYPPGGPWVLTSVTASGGDDEVVWPARDFWYYVAFVKDACGNVSAVSNRTNGTLNYHLGDVTDGYTVGVGDNLVGTVDITLLGNNYGLIGPAVTPVNYLDVGPTTDYSVNARPTTDNRIGFEDLIVFAINYGTVSAPGMIAERSFSGTDALAVTTEGEVAVGRTITARLRLSGSGRIQGLSAGLAWNPRAVVPVEFEAGELVTSANGVVFSPEAGTVDAALLGVREAGFTGEGELASVRFRVIGEGDPGIALGEVIARDANNQPVTLGEPSAVEGALPATTRLLAPMPNPSSSSSVLAFSLAKPGRVDLAVYSVDGRRVRTVLAESREAGFHNVSWDGAADDGRRVPAGVYFVRMTTADGARQSRTLTLLGR